MKMTLLVMLAATSTSLLANQTYREVQKSGCRRGIMDYAKSRLIHKSVILEQDRAEDLVDNPRNMVKNIEMMAKMKLTSGKSDIVPWSDSYWPLYKGGLGQRYNDSKFAALGWKESKEYVSLNTVEALVANGRTLELSPSEKYDVLLGLNQLPLTESNWSAGKEYFDEFGQVEAWMGLCHGWAAASMMMPEPKKKVDIETESGKMTFFPSDIKGLVTLLWAKGSFDAKYIGGRCNSRNPREDESGRSAETDCLDNNPGTWHLTVVNQLGVSKRPFIMDSSSSYEVWNQPVFSYEYTYVNPRTKKKVKNLKGALVRSGEWDDSKSKFRSKDTEYVVGIIMNVTYAVENEPSIKEDQEARSLQIEYEYDLELNQDHEIIGGEWDSSRHPDFLWVPTKKSFPQTYQDNGNQNFDFLSLSLEAKKVASINASYGLPWGPIIRDLVNRSSP